jgi:serine/threonine protein kinase
MTEDRLSELLLLWEERNEEGHPISPEELCSDSPELLAELKKRIVALRSMNAFLNDTPDHAENAQQPTTTGQTTTETPVRSFDEEFELPGYQILDEVGRGGMGVVYKARQLSLNRLVALKTFVPGEKIRPDDLARFKIEAEAVARLQHPNIVQIYEVGERNDRPYLSLEFLGGGSLEDKIQEGRPWPANDAAQLVEMLARAVYVAHQRSVIHRDLKPSNILFASLTGHERVYDPTRMVPKIVDFGLARCLESVGPRLTKRGTVLGTPAYMAPEQAAGKSEAIGPATDIHALGTILYELLTGQPPFDANSVYDTLRMVIRQPPTPPHVFHPGTPPALEEICLKCLEKDPADRYPSAEALADDLRRFQDNQPIRATLRPRTPSAPPVAPTTRRFYWAIGFILVAVAIVAVLHLWSDRTTPAPNGTNGGSSGEVKPKPITEADVRAKAAELRPLLLKALVKARTPDGWILARLGPDADPAKDEEVWAHSQALGDIFLSPDLPTEELAVWVPGLELPFAPGQQLEAKGVNFGWRAFGHADYPISPPALQTALALTAALARPGLLRGEPRERCLKHLRDAQAVLALYRPEPFTGGWNMFPQQKDPRKNCDAVTGMALQLLLELRKAGLPWEGSEASRDELLAATVRWVDREFDAAADPPGWRERGAFQAITGDGLTLMFYALRLRADLEAGIAVPPEMMEKIPVHLRRCTERDADYPAAPTVLILPFRNYNGEDVTQQQVITTHWYRWAIATSVLWLRHAEKRTVPTATVDGVRRALAHLVVTIGPRVVENSLGGSTFIAGANLNGLSQIPPTK